MRPYSQLSRNQMFTDLIHKADGAIQPAVLAQSGVDCEETAVNRVSHQHRCPSCQEPFNCCTEDCVPHWEIYCVKCYDVALAATSGTEPELKG
jgi:hypothetical protein